VNKQKEIELRRQRRRHHVRNRVRGTADCPRLTVQRSLKHISVQIVDDAARRTLASVSTRDRDVRGQIAYGGNKTAAETIGKLIAEKASKRESNEWPSIAGIASIMAALPRWPLRREVPDWPFSDFSAKMREIGRATRRFTVLREQ
jgi:large subunit ribosomal protein L18